MLCCWQLLYPVAGVDRGGLKGAVSALGNSRLQGTTLRCGQTARPKIAGMMLSKTGRVLGVYLATDASMHCVARSCPTCHQMLQQAAHANAQQYRLPRRHTGLMHQPQHQRQDLRQQDKSASGLECASIPAICWKPWQAEQGCTHNRVECQGAERTRCPGRLEVQAQGLVGAQPQPVCHRLRQHRMAGADPRADHRPQV